MTTSLRFLAVLWCCLTPFASAAETPRLSSERVIRLADAAAKADGYDLRRYERSRPSYHSSPGKPAWLLIYQAKSGETTVGDHFFVHVGDQDGNVKVSPGR